ncbi:hypothetical protein HY632_04855 [Candidatus Uhrbacteria bacterium]|nr:hypothetical protein [Candidatus Uhrbacteria bacterium]
MHTVLRDLPDAISKLEHIERVLSLTAGIEAERYGRQFDHTSDEEVSTTYHASMAGFEVTWGITIRPEDDNVTVTLTCRHQHAMLELTYETNAGIWTVYREGVRDNSTPGIAMEEFAERLQPHDEILEHKVFPAIEEFANTLRQLFLAIDAPTRTQTKKSPRPKKTTKGRRTVARP